MSYRAASWPLTQPVAIVRVEMDGDEVDAGPDVLRAEGFDDLPSISLEKMGANTQRIKMIGMLHAGAPGRDLHLGKRLQVPMENPAILNTRRRS